MVFVSAIARKLDPDRHGHLLHLHDSTRGDAGVLSQACCLTLDMCPETRWLHISTKQKDSLFLIIVSLVISCPGNKTSNVSFMSLIVLIDISMVICDSEHCSIHLLGVCMPFTRKCLLDAIAHL